MPVADPTTDPHDDLDSRPLQELRRLSGGRCQGCGAPYSGREAVASIILGFKDAPRCVPCLARGLRRDAVQLRHDLVAHARRRECFGRALAEAERIDGPSADWPPLAETSALVMIEATPPTDGLALVPAEVWDAGDLGCGELVLALRGRMNALPSGAVLQVTATDPAAPEDLPAWCRLTGHGLVRMSHPDYYIRRREG
jgi:tRNA 2-thiouridine synthesizing protein A